MQSSPINISIVAPLFNEEGNVKSFVTQVLDVMKRLGNSFEIILVDDGSTDNTWLQIEALASEFDEVIGVGLSRNFGHQGALLAGLHQSRGDAIISMDGDLQHPPESIEELINCWRNGANIVLTRRIDEEKTSAFKKLTSKYFYSVFSSIAETKIEPGSSDFRLMDRQSLSELLKLHYGEPFLRGAVNTLGFKTEVIDYRVGDRLSGASKYTLSKMLSFARHGLISHSSVPLRAGIYLGMITGFLSLLELFYVTVQAFRGETVAGWASTLGILSFLFSVLFIILGVIGLYLEDIHSLLKQKPHFIISNIAGERPKTSACQDKVTTEYS